MGDDPVRSRSSRRSRCLTNYIAQQERLVFGSRFLDVVVDNFTLSGRNLLPNIISVEPHNFFKFSPYDGIPDDDDDTFTFTLDQMQADIRDVAFYFRKKTGIPKMSDSGLTNVFLGGNGLHVSSADRLRTLDMLLQEGCNVKVQAHLIPPVSHRWLYCFEHFPPLSVTSVPARLSTLSLGYCGRLRICGML